MASLEIDTAKVGPIRIGQIETMDPCRIGGPWLPLAQRPEGLCIIAEDGTHIEATMPKGYPEDSIRILTRTFEALGYGNPGDDCELLLTDIRAALAAQDARDAARRDA